MTSPGIDETHDPKRRSWIDSAVGHADFPVQNLPFGIFSRDDLHARIGVAIGDMVLDLPGCSGRGLLPHQTRGAFRYPTLNALMALPSTTRRALRTSLSDLLSDPSRRADVEPLLVPASECKNALARGHRRLHRFLCRHPSRDECRPTLQARQSAPCELQIRTDRLSRPRVLDPTVR
jgi:hypothetical protein